MLILLDEHRTRGNWKKPIRQPSKLVSNIECRKDVFLKVFHLILRNEAIIYNRLHLVQRQKILLRKKTFGYELNKPTKKHTLQMANYSQKPITE